MTERFTLVSELGRGGMGVVWKARDEETGQIVALKLLREAYADDPDYLGRFERELELARRIDSPNVVKVLGYGVRQGVPYLALEYVDGQSLRDLIASHGPYTWDETKALLAQIARGLGDAHAAGVIHRDVKPSNVLLAPDGTAKLTDFGIARGLDLTRVTATSTLLGTPAYLPPEGPEDERSDLYSLGVIGYELLVGAPPFDGKTYQAVMLAHLRTPPDLEKLPAAAQPILGWLLAKEPTTRPQSAGELLAVLEGKRGVPAGSVAEVAVPAPTPPPAPLPIAPPPVAPSPVHAPYPAYPSYAAAPPPYGRERGPRRRSGLVVFGAIAAVLLIASVAFAGVFLSGTSSPTASLYVAGAAPTSTATATSALTTTNSPTPAASTFTQYQVKTGDTLALIAAKFNITLPELLAANPQLTSETPAVGQIINIPPRGYTTSPAATGTATVTPTATPTSARTYGPTPPPPTPTPTPTQTPTQTTPTLSPSPTTPLYRVSGTLVGADGNPYVGSLMVELQSNEGLGCYPCGTPKPVAELFPTPGDGTWSLYSSPGEFGLGFQFPGGAGMCWYDVLGDCGYGTHPSATITVSDAPVSGIVVHMP